MENDPTLYLSTRCNNCHGWMHYRPNPEGNWIDLKNNARCTSCFGSLTEFKVTQSMKNKALYLAIT